ncbi:hypothetical protein MUU72_04280 [Streptomyces sp. RS10V-4]|uniref:hypothetical protein n=1 Tax=Streptomyces rhizoryzae TaxID=2932493 RepID=UPI002003E9E1|nr:hypothetical protein [Streptomyces rhizoryzae]MCK7622346.1 hypothetical protein [Streptomyces rhizoryzae]
MATSHERLAAFGSQLIEVHLWLREEPAEKRIVAALNALNVPEWRDTPPAFLRTDDAAG